MGFLHAVKGELVFLTPVFFQPPAYFIIQMKGIAKNRKGDILLFQKSQQLPEIRMQDRIAARDIEIRQTTIYLAEVYTVASAANS